MLVKLDDISNGYNGRIILGKGHEYDYGAVASCNILKGSYLLHLNNRVYLIGAVSKSQGGSHMSFYTDETVRGIEFKNSIFSDDYCAIVKGYINRRTGEMIELSKESEHKKYSELEEYYESEMNFS